MEKVTGKVFFVILSRSSDKLNLSHRTLGGKKNEISESWGGGMRAKKMFYSVLASGSLQLFYLRRNTQLKAVGTLLFGQRNR